LGIVDLSLKPKQEIKGTNIDSRVSKGGVRANYFGAAEGVYLKLALGEAHST
jgi:hypothetical protein